MRAVARVVRAIRTIFKTALAKTTSSTRVVARPSRMPCRGRIRRIARAARAALARRDAQALDSELALLSSGQPARSVIALHGLHGLVADAVVHAKAVAEGVGQPRASLDLEARRRVDRRDL